MNNKTVIKTQNPLRTFITCSVFILLISRPIYASEGEHRDEDTHNAEFVLISDNMAQKMGVVTQKVSAGQLNITTTVYGNVVTDPASLSHVRARFDGMVTKVNANLGYKVKKGETLAIVESNESLKSYPVTAPFSGSVIARHANEGELSNGQVLFSIANYEDVWAQLKIFPQQLSEIADQQSVQLSLSEAKLNTTIQHILPSPDEKPYVLAYAKIANTSGRWPVGAAIKGLVTINKLDVAMMVPKAAIQEFEGTSVVFVKEGEEYHPVPVMLGQQDSNNIEVLSGLHIADVIVSQNSYLFKADLEKSEAGHDH
ncbi:efflux RND transporter periplasmic adaptor subunit [Alteromonas sp. C1M14]|uniref:efflux RND transporter periplasmic adaptor subunit n=1 Tax=Alteromonas sp. C1M14 TaxID=2841567 RepID=UPI001C0A3E34|nr:efflux RND transporter periplasmic adaptor subunit [Alteromonas sp. C1M14]MBU2977902.1 efflux RND transporter periplasmic adaptor subunit [Alteromonas sp. C1M14]